MADLIASGRIAELILLLTACEALGLFLLRRFAGWGLDVVDFLPNLLAGDFLLLAWFASARGEAWPWSAAALLAALVCHLTDLGMRWR